MPPRGKDWQRCVVSSQKRCAVVDKRRRCDRTERQRFDRPPRVFTHMRIVCSADEQIAFFEGVREHERLPEVQRREYSLAI